MRKILQEDFDIQADQTVFLAERSIEKAVRCSDAIITVTPSRNPLIKKKSG